jgi:hypothetical protein
MQIPITALLALLPALGSATSYLVHGGTDGGNSEGAIFVREAEAENAGDGGSGRNDCGMSWFVNLSQSDGAAPLVSDCQDMLQQIRSDREWLVLPTQRTLVSQGTCKSNDSILSPYSSSGR